MRVLTVSELAQCDSECTCHGTVDMAHEAMLDAVRRLAFGASERIDVNSTVSRIEQARQTMTEDDYSAMLERAIKACL